MFAGVGERTREGNDLYREMIEGGVIKLGDKVKAGPLRLPAGRGSAQRERDKPRPGGQSLPAASCWNMSLWSLFALLDGLLRRTGSARCASRRFSHQPA